MKQRAAMSMIALLAVSGPAAAAGQSGSTDDWSKTYKTLDANHDGAVSQAEARGMKGLPEIFPEADADRDGRLNQEEFKVAYRKVTEQ